MRIIYSIFLFSFFSCFQSKKQINKECKLVTLPKKSVSCGVLSVWEGVKFLDIKDNEIFIGFIHCPETFSVNFFDINAKYKLQLDSKLPDSLNNIVINSFKGENLQCFTIKEIKHLD